MHTCAKKKCVVPNRVKERRVHVWNPRCVPSASNEVRCEIMVHVHLMSCLFESLSTSLHVDAHAIRTMICDYLASNQTLLEGVDTTSLFEQDRAGYVDWMRRSDTWGGAIEIKAACEIWNACVHVHNVRDADRSTIVFRPDTRCDPSQRIDLYWTGSHYYTQ